MDDKNRKSRLIALLATLFIAAAIVVLLVCGSLRSTLKEGRTWPPERHSEILFEEIEEETFVPLYSQAGDNLLEPFDGDGPGASDITDDGPTQTSHDATDNASTQGTTTKVTTSERPVPAQVKPNDRKEGNAKPKEDAAKAEAERRQKTEQNISDKLNDRFSGKGKSTGTKENDKDVDGNKASGGNSAGKGLGMTASADVRPSSNVLGTIVVSVIVLPDGKVKPGSASINVSRCSGNAGNDTALRQRCLKAAEKCRFSRPAGESNNLPGSITFKWE